MCNCKEGRRTEACSAADLEKMQDGIDVIVKDHVQVADCLRPL